VYLIPEFLTVKFQLYHWKHNPQCFSSEPLCDGQSCWDGSRLDNANQEAGERGTTRLNCPICPKSFVASSKPVTASVISCSLSACAQNQDPFEEHLKHHDDPNYIHCHVCRSITKASCRADQQRLTIVSHSLTLCLQRQWHMDRHMLRHSGERAYVCKRCGAAFSRVDNLVCFSSVKCSPT
jgi:hypothetical protein